MVIGTQDVNQPLEPPLTLFQVIGDVRGEIGLLPVLAHDDPILLIAELSGPEPQCAVLAKEPRLSFQASKRALDRAALGKGPLRVPAVEFDPELPQVLADIREHVRERQLGYGAETLRHDQLARPGDEGIYVGLLVARRRVRRQVRQDLRSRPLETVAAFGAQLPGDGAHVVASVAVLRKREGLAPDLQIPHPNAGCEDVDLASRIVDVVLALHFVAGGGQQIGKGRAVGCLATVPDMQRSCGICRDELNEDLLTATERAAPVLIAPLVDVRQLAGVSVGREEEIDEAGAGDFRPRNEGVGRQSGHDRLRQLARIASRRFRKAQRDVAREVPVLRVARALDHDRGGVGRLG